MSEIQLKSKQRLLVENGVIFWTSGLAIDADGCPKAYGPPNSGALDYLANAGSTGNWWGLACNSKGLPYIQGPEDPCPGMYVSTTSLVDHAKAGWDPARYVDSGLVPYIAIPRELLNAGVQLGDLGVAYNAQSGDQCYFVVADVGPRGKVGEGSIALARALGVPEDPKHGGCTKGLWFAIFLGTSQGWPRTEEGMLEQITPLFEAWGGVEHFTRT
jgi:hypothetical protein